MKKLSLFMILSVLILILATACNKQVFNGSRTSNDAQFILQYSILNSTKTHEIKLEKGSIINVIIESKSGSVDVFVEDAEGEKIYKGDDTASGKFSLEIPKTSTYKFSVTGKNAKGSVSFKTAK
jgi:hypothetical protein